MLPQNLQFVEDNPRFPCNVSLGVSAEPPESVHRLRPGDIDIVGAMGDSLTAANGAMALNVLQVANENRGLSWTGGGSDLLSPFPLRPGHDVETTSLI